MALRSMLKSKIHRATITDADIEYEGSITIDADLMDAARLIENESVYVWDVTNGARLKTYVIKGRRGSGEVVMNGAAAHVIRRDDLVIVSSFIFLNDQEIMGYKPVKVFVDERNRIKSIS